MAANIQLRRDLSAAWITANPVLAQGELGVELDTRKAKLGDGITAWVSLPYCMDTTSSDKSYLHDQAVPSDTWVVTHGLGKFPSVTVVDSAGSEVEGSVTHDSANQVTLSFNGAFAGKAYLN